jgi:hypothetical protein
MKPNGIKVGAGYLALTQKQKEYNENSTNATKEQK